MKATFAYLKSIEGIFEQSIVITKDISEDEIEEIKKKILSVVYSY